MSAPELDPVPVQMVQTVPVAPAEPPPEPPRRGKSGTAGAPQADDLADAKTINFRIPIPIWRKLHYRKIETDCSIPEILNEAVRLYLESPPAA